MLKQTLQQKLQQKLSPAQIQLMKLLQLPITSLEQRIKEEMEINPALEDDSEEEMKDEKEEDDLSDDEREEKEEQDEGADNEDAAKDDFSAEDYFDDDDDIAYYKLQVNNKGKDDEDKSMPMASSVSFQETLFSQLQNLDLSEQERIIAEYLIGSIDEDGYIRRDLNSIVDDMAFSQNITTTIGELESVLKLIQDEFEPAGIGAKDLKECLKLQLERKKWNETRAFALKIVVEQMDEFSKKHFKKIADYFQIKEEDPKLKDALDEILKLNPRPGGSARESEQVRLDVIPDFLLYNNNGTLELTLNGRNAPDLRVSGLYQQMLNEYSGRKDKTGIEAVQFVKQKIEGAKSFINNIKERQNTLYNIMNCILEYQKEYFLTGDELLLKPMILKDISDRVKLDISTVSRVTSTKYVQTNFGTILLKSLFNEAISTEDGEDISSKKVKKIISDAIEAEDKHKPLTDEALMQILNKQGFVIARRTVAKYREMLEIPVARMRKKL